MNVADKIVEILESEGINHVFGIPGEQKQPKYKSLTTTKKQPHKNLH
ncbi:thiamine pyrophosphate-binding protein [Methanobrevibacter gottschalkii]|nr:thiamine pyrophosphate-binding protein [Methanobrevibacter gottschalkii]